MIPSSMNAKTHHAAAAAALQWAHLDSISALNCKAMAEEVQNVKLLQRSSQWPSKPVHWRTCWTLMYPLQLLTSSIPLVPLLGMPATAWTTGHEQTQGPSQQLLPQVYWTLPVPQPSIKWWHHSFWSRHAWPRARWRGSPWLTHAWSSPPTKSGSQWLKFSKRLNKRPSLKTLKWWGQSNGPTVRPTKWSLSKKGCMT